MSKSESAVTGWLRLHPRGNLPRSPLGRPAPLALDVRQHLLLDPTLAAATNPPLVARKTPGATSGLPLDERSTGCQFHWGVTILLDIQRASCVGLMKQIKSGCFSYPTIVGSCIQRGHHLQVHQTHKEQPEAARCQQLNSRSPGGKKTLVYLFGICIYILHGIYMVYTMHPTTWYVQCTLMYINTQTLANDR